MHLTCLLYLINRLFTRNDSLNFEKIVFNQFIMSKKCIIIIIYHLPALQVL
jgi:hypothetical protein